MTIINKKNKIIKIQINFVFLLFLNLFFMPTITSQKLPQNEGDITDIETPKNQGDIRKNGNQYLKALLNPTKIKFISL